MKIVQFKFNNIFLVSGKQVWVTNWCLTDYAVLPELPVVHMTKIHIQHQLMMPQMFTAAGWNFSSAALVILCQ